MECHPPLPPAGGRRTESVLPGSPDRESAAVSPAHGRWELQGEINLPVCILVLFKAMHRLKN